MEIKGITTKPESIDGRTVTGLAAIFGNVDAYGDRMMHGAFKKTINENSRRIRHLWMHDPTQPPTAAIKELKEVGRSQIPAWVKDEHPEVTGGLMVVREYLDTERGNEIFEGIKAGAINEMSFGYEAVKFDFETDPNSKAQIRNLKEVRLFDISDVTWGANNLTVAAKSEGYQGLKALLAEYASNPPEYKAGGLAVLLQNAAGHLMTLPEAVTPNVEQSIKALMDLLTAEPQTGEDLAALTEQLLAEIAIAEHEFDYL